MEVWAREAGWGERGAGGGVFLAGGGGGMGRDDSGSIASSGEQWGTNGIDCPPVADLLLCNPVPNKYQSMAQGLGTLKYTLSHPSFICSFIHTYTQ